MGIRVGFAKTNMLVEDPVLRDVERQALQRANIPLTFNLDTQGKYLGIWMTMVAKLQRRLLFAEPIEKLQGRSKNTPARGRKHHIQQWNTRLLPLLSWVGQCGRPHPKDRSRIQYEASYYVQARGDQAVSMEIMWDLDFLYGSGVTVIDLDIWFLSISARVSHWFEQREWEAMLGPMEEWDAELKEATFVSGIYNSRDEVSDLMGLPWKTLVSDYHKRKRLTLAQKLEKLGLMKLDKQPAAPRRPRWSLFVDGGGLAPEEKNPDTASAFPTVLGGRAWSLQTPTKKRVAEGGGPMRRLGFDIDQDFVTRGSNEVASALREIETSQQDRYLPWSALHMTNITNEMAAVLDFLTFFIGNYRHPHLQAMMEDGPLMLVYDNRAGCDVARGAWVSEQEPALGVLLRRACRKAACLGLGIEPWWQGSHVIGTDREGPADNMWVILGNERADLLVAFLRWWGMGVAGWGQLLVKRGEQGNFAAPPRGRIVFEQLILDEEDLSGAPPQQDSQTVDSVAAWLEEEDFKLDSCVYSEEKQDKWRPQLMHEDRALAKTQSLFYRALRGTKWLQKTSWRLAERKIKSRWPQVGLSEFRAASLQLEGLLPRVRFARIDLAHNAWLTGGRRTRVVKEVPPTFVRHKSVSWQKTFHARAEAARAHNLIWDRPCLFCKQPHMDRAEHYFNEKMTKEYEEQDFDEEEEEFEGQKDRGGCPAVRNWARRIGLIGPEQFLSIRLVLGAETLGQPNRTRRFGLFVHSVWRQLGWKNGVDVDFCWS